MPDPVDDLDRVLRRALATLDDQVPPGTFDTFPDRTLARLDASVLDHPARAHRGRVLAVVGVVVAAAAAATVFVSVSGRDRLAGAPAAMQDTTPALTARSETMPASPAPAAPRSQGASEGVNAGANGGATDAASGAPGANERADLRASGGSRMTDPSRPAHAAGSGSGEPARTRLSGDDISRAMAAVRRRVRACAHGGQAGLEVHVRPSGQVAQVVVSGALAGTEAGACIERTVRAAVFPPWNGAAQRFTYALPLSE
ncbi:MAG TPA: hypothetical protein VFK02_30185 [Kofleriaceae bacterium]|nr:hypothetical protein [Kofleriaceae bacterium]